MKTSNQELILIVLKKKLIVHRVIFSFRWYLFCRKFDVMDLQKSVSKPTENVYLFEHLNNETKGTLTNKNECLYPPSYDLTLVFLWMLCNNISRSKCSVFLIGCDVCLLRITYCSLPLYISSYCLTVELFLTDWLYKAVSILFCFLNFNLRSH